MKYRIKLANKANGDEAEVIVPSHTPLEDLSVKIKLEMHLPYSDGGWHRFLVGGAADVFTVLQSAVTYTQDERLVHHPQSQLHPR